MDYLFHYIVLEKAQTDADVAAAALWTSSALYWSNPFFHFFSHTTYFSLKKRLNSCLIHDASVAGFVVIFCDFIRLLFFN